jgi:hypothetical protein
MVHKNGGLMVSVIETVIDLQSLGLMVHKNGGLITNVIETGINLQ